MKLTRKDVISLAGNLENVYSVGYCALHYLLSTTQRRGYNFGVYGWNYDVYKIEDIVIITGYRPFKAKRIPNDLTKKYENLAKAVKRKNSDYEEKANELKKLCVELIEELKAGNQ